MDECIDVNMIPDSSGRRGPSFPIPRPLRAAAGAPDALLKGASHLSGQLASLTSDAYARFLVLAAIIGLAAAMSVTLLYRVIDAVQRLTLGWAEVLPFTDVLVVPLLVAAGLLVSRFLVRHGAGDSAGENVPDVMYRASLSGGQIPGRPVLAKLSAAAVLIGTGGSVGAEGPVIVGGAAAGSRIG